MRKGRIPTSIFHGIKQNSNSCEVKGYGIDGKFIDTWRENGINLNKPIILYCGNGWRASLIMVYALLHGVKDISLYSNGWM